MTSQIKLELGGETLSNAATDQDIINALNRLFNSDTLDDRFVIMSMGESFLQTAVNLTPTLDIIMIWHDHRRDRWYMCKNQDLDQKSLLEAFLLFAHDGDLQQHYSWELDIIKCSACGRLNIVGSTYCDVCRAPLDTDIDLFPPIAETLPPMGMKDRSGVVYLLCVGNWYKIGKTNDPLRRYRELDIQLPHKPERLHHITTNDIHHLERHWHRYLREKRGNGEWFQLDQADIDEFTSYDNVQYKDD